MKMLLEKCLLRDLLKTYPDVDYLDERDLIGVLQDIYAEYRIRFIFIIDEWDCIFRENKDGSEAHKMYLDFLRNLLKDRSYVALAYMTGILPIKKYGTHSALNMFDEFSMTNPKQLAEFVGFTESEVKGLCNRYGMDFEETRRWYDGYHFENVEHVYSPRSVTFNTKQICCQKHILNRLTVLTAKSKCLKNILTKAIQYLIIPFYISHINQPSRHYHFLYWYYQFLN